MKMAASAGFGANVRARIDLRDGLLESTALVAVMPGSVLRKRLQRLRSVADTRKVSTIARGALFASTALVGVALASPAAAQQTIATPAQGGTISGPSASGSSANNQTTADPTTSGGLTLSLADAARATQINAVTITNASATPNADALHISAAGANTVSLRFNGVNTLTSNVSGGASVYLTSGANSYDYFLASGSTLTGSYGFYGSTPSGQIDLNTQGFNENFVANGSAVAGVYLRAGNTATTELAASTISGFATGVDVGGSAVTVTTTGGSIAGTTYGIRTSGSATIVLGGAVSGGTNSLLLDASGNAVTLNSGATLTGIADLGGGTNTLTLAGAGTTDTLNAGTLVNATKLVKSGTGTWTLSGVAAASDFTGGTTVNAGTLMLTSAAALNNSGANLPITVGQGATLYFAQTDASNPYTYNEFSTIAGAGNVTFAGNSLFLRTAATYTGATLVRNNGNLELLPVDAIASSSGLTLDSQNGNVTDVSLRANQHITTLSSTGTGINAIYANGGNYTLTLTNASGTYNGVFVNVSGGVGSLVIAGGSETLGGGASPYGTLGPLYSGGTTINSGAMLTATTATAIGTGAVVDNGALAFNGASGTVTNAISGSGGITVSNTGTGTLTFSGALAQSNSNQTYIVPLSVLDSSNVTISGSIAPTTAYTNALVTLAAAGTFTNLGTMTIGNGAQGIYSNGNTTDGGIINNGSTTVSTASIQGGDRGILYAGGTASLTINNWGAIQSTQYNGIQYDNSGTLTLNNNGGTIYGQGTANVGYAGVEASGANLIVVNTGTIVGSSSGISTGGTATITNSGTIGGGTLAGGTFTPGGAGFAVQIGSGTIINSGTLQSGEAAVSQTSATGTLVLTNTGTIGGTTTAQAPHGGDPDDTLIAQGVATIFNSGTIASPNFYAIGMGQGGTVTNAAGGLIQAGTADANRRGIVSNGALAVTNYGTINSQTYNLGIQVNNNAQATIVLEAGSTTGTITTGSAADTLTLYNGLGSQNQGLLYNTATGTTTSGGTAGANQVVLQGSGAQAAAVVGAINLGGGGDTVSLRGTGDGTTTNGVGGTLSLTGSTNLGTLTKQDVGTWTLGGNASGTGITQINAGLGGAAGSGGLLIFGETNLGAVPIAVNGATIRATTAGGFGTGTITATDPTIQYNATGTYTNAIVLASTDTVNDPTILQTYGTGITATLSGNISQSGGTAQPLIFSSTDTTGAQNTGTFVLQGIGSYAGLTTINAGTTVVDSGLGAAQNGTAGVSFASLGNGGVTIASGGTLQFDNQSGAQRYVKGDSFTGTGTIAFTGNAGSMIALGYGGNGNVYINLSKGGLVDVRNGTVQGSTSGEGIWTNAAGTVQNQGGLNIAAGATFDGVEGAIYVDTLTGSGTLRGGYAGTRTTTIGTANGTATFNGIIADSTNGSALALTKTGTGTQTLTGTNTYTGATTISGGTLALSGAGSIANSAITDNATLDVSGNTGGGTTIASLSGNGTVTLGGNTLTVGGNNASTTFSGTITGSNTPAAYVGQWNPNSGPIYYSHPTVYSGVQAAAYLFGGTASQYQTSTVSNQVADINNKAWINVYGRAAWSVEDQNYRVDNGAAGYNQNGDASAYVQDGFDNSHITYAFNLGSTGGLTKTGTGTLTLSGTNSWSGVTTVSGGTLQGNTTSISGGSILDNATLAYVQAGSGSAAQSISGSGIVTVSGLTGTNAVTFNGALTNAGGVTAGTAGNVTIGATGSVSNASTNGALYVTGAGDIVTVAQGGSVTSTQTTNGNFASAIYGTGAGYVVNNAGTIAAPGNVGATYGSNGIYATNGVTVNNTGKIYGIPQGSTATYRGDGVFAANAAAIVNNTGATLSGGVPSGSTAGGGVITGGWDGVFLTGGGSVYNSGTIAGNLYTGVEAATSVTNYAGGRIVSPGNGIAASAATITNSGLIAVGTYNSTSGAIALATNGSGIAVAGATILNGAAGATAAQNAASIIQGGRGIYDTGGTLMLTNYGVVTGTSTTFAAVDTVGAGSTITNYSTLQGGTQGIVLNSGGTVYNYGAGSAIKGTSTSNTNDASGIYANGALSLTNQGTISTASTGVSYGVQVQGVGTILNTGTITGNAAGVRSGGALTLTNAYNGTIGGAANTPSILLAAGGTIANDGAMAGGITATAGATTISLYGGSTTGAIALANGVQNVVNLNNGTGTGYAGFVNAGGTTLEQPGANAAAAFGTIALGTGTTNRVNLYGAGDGTATNGVAGTIDLSTVTGANALVKLATGTWTLTGASASPAVAITAGNGTPSGLLIFSGSGLTGAINVNGATIREAVQGGFGTGTITETDPTTQFAYTGTNANNYVLASTNPSTDPTVFQTYGDGIAVTLAGTITEQNAPQPLTFGSVDANGNANSGTFVLANAENAWTGVTTIAGGNGYATTLQGTTDTISGGSIVDNGVLAFVQSASGTFAKDVSGTGGITVSGTGTNTLTFAGALTNAGGLAILDASNVTLSGSINAAHDTGFVTLGSGTFTNTGSITTTAYDAVETAPTFDAIVVNNGTIQGDASAVISLYSTNTGALSVTNFGTIQGVQYDGVTQHGSGALTVTNSGTIYGQNSSQSGNGYGVGSDGGGQLTLINTAGSTIVGNYGVVGSNAGDIVTNTGLIASGSYAGGVLTIGGTNAIELRAGGTVGNDAAGQIIGNSYGIRSLGATMLNNAGQLVGGYAGIEASGAITITGNTGTIGAGTLSGTTYSGTGGQDGVRALGGGTIVNSGLIEGDNGSGIYFEAADLTVTNNNGGQIIGGQGIYTFGSSGEGLGVTNTAGAVINGAGDGVHNGGSGAVTVNNAGQITGGNVGIYAAGLLTLTNTGTVTGNSQSQAAINAGDVASTITNYGTIQGGTQAIVLTNGGTIYNYGTGSVLQASTPANYDDASGVYANGTLLLINQGTISTANTGANSYGVEVTGNGTGAITNSGMIAGVVGGVSLAGGGTITNTSTGTIGAGTVATANGTTTFTANDATAISGSGSLAIDNSGAIRGFVATANGTALTIVNRAGGSIVSTAATGDLMYPVDGTVSIINAGTISTTGFSATGVEGQGTATITNAATGVIQGGNDTTYGQFGNAVQFGGTNTQTFNNYGSATSMGGQNAVYGTNSGATTVNLFAGSTTGNIALGSGANTVSLHTGAVTTTDTVDTTSGVVLQAAGTYAAASFGTIALGSGSANTLNLNGAGDGIAANGAAGTLDIGTVTGASAIVKNDAGTWNVSGTDTNTAAWTINGGLLTVSGGNAIADTSAVTVNAGGTLGLLSSETIGSLAGNGTVALGAKTLTLASDASTTFAGGASGTGGIVKQGTGTLTLSGSNSFTGTLEIAGGTVAYGANDVLADTATVLVDAGTTFNLNGHSDTIGTLNLYGTLANGGLLTAANYNAYAGSTIGQAISSGTLNVYGNTSLTAATAASPVNIYAGTLTTSGGDLSGTGAVNIASGGELKLGGAETIGSLSDLNGTGGTVDLAGNLLTVGGDNSNTTFSGVISSSAAAGLTYVGSYSVGDGPVWYSNPAPQVYSGQDAAALLFGGSASDYAISTVGSSVAQVNHLAYLDGYADTTYLDNPASESYSLGDANGQYNYPAFSAYVQDHTSPGDYVNYVFRNIVDTNGLTKTGTGTLTLSGANTYTGTTTVNGGTLALAGGQAIADGNAVVVNAGGTLALLNSERIGTLDGAGALSLGANTLFLGTNNGSSTFTGIASGTGGITQTGTGTLTLSGANTYTGTTLVSGGSFVLGASNALADASTLSLQNATGDIGANSDTIATLVLTNSTLTGTTGTLTAQSYALSNGTLNAMTGTGYLYTQSNNVNSTINAASAAGTIETSGGTLTLGASNLLADTAAVYVDRGSILDLQGNSDTVGSLSLQGTLNGTGTLTAANYFVTAGTVNANLGTGALYVSRDPSTGDAVSTLNGTAAATVVQVNGQATLALGASDRLADTAQVTVNANGTLDIAGYTDTVGSLALNGTLAGTGTLTAANYALNGATVNANLGAGTLTQIGGTSVLNGTSGAGTVTVNGGTLALGASDRLADTAAVTVNANGTLDIAGYTDTVGSLALNGTLAGTGTLTAATYALNGATVNANLGAGTLNQIGGTSMLNGTSGAGTVNVNAGTLVLGSAERLADTAAVAVANGAQLTLGGTETIGTLSGAGTVALGANTLVLSNAADTFSGMIGGSGGLTLTSGNETLSGTNSYAGTTTIGTGATLTGTTASFSPNSAVTDNGTLAFVQGTSGTYAQAIAGSGTVTVAGLGANNALTFTGTNTQTGGFQVTDASTTVFAGADSGAATEVALQGASRLVNTGSIAGTTTGVAASAATGTTTIVNAATGTITGGSYAVQGSGAGALTLVNYGTLGGAVSALSTGTNTLSLRAGSTTGAVTTGTGNDNLNLYTGAVTTAPIVNAATGVTVQAAGTYAAAVVGAVDLGAGSNVLNLRGLGDGSAVNGAGGSIDLSTVANAGTITKQDAGTWTLGGTVTDAVTSAATINAGVGGTPGSGGLLVFAGSGLTGTINVNGATIRATQAGAFGTGTINTIDPTVQYAASGTYANPIVLQSTNPATDPTTLQTYGAGITATLTGAITEANPPQPLVFSSIDANGNASTGTFVLTNAGNAWSGVTTINAGTTLQGTTASISGGSITDNGVVNFNQTVAGTNARAISGNGIVQVNGGGNVSLTGALTTTGGVQIATGGIATLSNASGNGNTVVTLTGANATLNVAQGGRIAATNGGAVFGVAANGIVNNAGTISSTGTGFNAVYFNANLGTASVTNTGAVSAVGSAIYAGAGTALSVTNSGTLTSTNRPAILANTATITNMASGVMTGFFGVYTTGAMTLANAGQITAAGASGNAVTAGGGSLVNTGTLTATTSGGWGVLLTAAGSADNQGTINADSGLVAAVSGVTFSNEGTINAAVNGVWGLGSPLTLTNSGTINAGTTGVLAEATGSAIANGGTIAGSASGAIGVAMAGGTLTNRSGGTISAGQTNGVYGTAIQLSGTGNVLALQAGSTVNGTIDASATTDGSNSYTVSGTLNGRFTAGSGNDTLTLVTPVTVSGTLDGGAGTDTLVLDGTGAGTLGSAQVVNFENGVKQGSGTWTLTGTTAASPTAFAINAGTLAIAGGNALADNAAVTIASAGTLQLNASETIGSLAGAGNVMLGANTLTTGTANASPTFSGTIAGSGSLTKVGTGTLTLSGVNTYTGATTVSAGTLALGASNVLADATNVAVAGGTTLDLGANSDTVASLALSGTLAGTGTLTAATYSLNGATVNANLGAGTLTNAGGTSVLNGTAGAATVNVNAGTLALGASNRLADNATVAVASGATLNMNAFTDTVGTATLAGTLAGTGTLTAATYALNGATVTANLGTGMLAQLSGTSVLNGTVGTGTVLANAGTLRLGAAERIVDTANLMVASGATFDLAGYNETVGTLSGTGNVALGAGTLTTGGTNADYGFGGVVSGSGDLTKTGTGTFTLVGNETMTGRINANAGNLLFVGTTAGGVRVQGGTLTGMGSIAGQLAISGGTFSPGTATLAVAGFQAGSLAVTGGTSVFDFTGSTGGYTADTIRVSGAATLAGGNVVARATEATANYRLNNEYTLVQAGTLTGTYANGTSFAQASGNPDLYWRLRYDLVPNAVLLEVRKVVDFTSTVGAGASANQLAVAGALNGGTLTGSDSYINLLNRISLQSASAQRATFDSIGGESIADITTTAALMGQRFTDLLRERLAVGGSGNFGSGLGSGNGDASMVAAMGDGSKGMQQLRAASQMSGGSALAGTNPEGGRGSAWVQTFGGAGRLDGRNGTATLQDQSYGVAAGLDGRVGAFTLGGAFAATSLDTRVAARTATNSGTLYQGGGYAAYDDGQLYASVIGSYFSGDVDTRRSVFVGGNIAGVATGKTRTRGYTAGGAIGYRADLGSGVRFSPQAAFETTHVVRGAFTESGAGDLSLNVARQNRDLYTATVEGRFSHVSAAPGGVIEPYVGGGAQFNWGDRDTLSSMRFTGAPTGTGAFAITGARIAPVTALVTGGIEAHPNDRVTLGAGVETHLSDRQREGRIQMHVRLGF